MCHAIGVEGALWNAVQAQGKWAVQEQQLRAVDGVGGRGVAG